MKCAAPGCRRARVLLVGVCLPHWKTLSPVEQEAIETTWLNLQKSRTEQNESAFHEALALAMPGLPVPPAKLIKPAGSRSIYKLSQLAKRRIEKGLCTTCGKNPARPGRRTCSKCQKTKAEWMKTARRQNREGLI